jgi:hypothetical protein
MDKLLLACLAMATVLVIACVPIKSAPEAQQIGNCGDGVCQAMESSTGSCPGDCPKNTANQVEAEKKEEAPVQAQEGCVGEGGTIPVIPNPPVCCNGLALIDRKESSILGISGICTAKCGNGACDAETESPKNCPSDCPLAPDARPICDSPGTTKEGWYQNDKILMYARCAGCSAECRNKGTASEGWYNTCDNKQIKRMCG